MAEVVPLIWVVVSNILYFHPYLGKIPNLTNMFQRGWNHQPVIFLLPCFTMGFLDLFLPIRSLILQVGIFGISFPFPGRFPSFRILGGGKTRTLRYSLEDCGVGNRRSSLWGPSGVIKGSRRDFYRLEGARVSFLRGMNFSLENTCRHCCTYTQKNRVDLEKVSSAKSSNTSHKNEQSRKIERGLIDGLLTIDFSVIKASASSN